MAAERPARPAPMMRMFREMPVLGMALRRGELIFQVCWEETYRVKGGGEIIKQKCK